MSIASINKYKDMIQAAFDGQYAYPAINVTSSQTLNAALRGFAESDSDGIIQISTGGAQYFSGALNDMYYGAIAFAKMAHVLANKYSVNIALHTDHCSKDKLDYFVLPLLHYEKNILPNQETLFQSHMWDGSAIDLDSNLNKARELLKLSNEANTLLEIEIGVVGGEEDGVDNAINDKLYSTPEDALNVIDILGNKNMYMVAATFGNVHGVYKPGNVKLKPSILNDIQNTIYNKHKKKMYLVFHGGSGSELHEFHEAIKYGVIKVNIDTDTQYSFTRNIADHLFKNYDKILKIDNEVGNKKYYDPRVYGKKAEESMCQRVIQACKEFGSYGKSIK